MTTHISSHRLCEIGVSQASVLQILQETCMELFDYGNSYMRTIKKQLETRMKSQHFERTNEAEFRVSIQESRREDVTIRELVINIDFTKHVLEFRFVNCNNGRLWRSNSCGKHLLRACLEGTRLRYFKAS